MLVATLTALLRVRLAEARYRRLFETRLLGIVHEAGEGGGRERRVPRARRLLASRPRRGRVRWDGTGGRGAGGRRPPRRGADGDRAIRSDGGASVLIGEDRLEGKDEGVAFVLDISQRKSAEEALREADRRKNEFLGRALARAA